VYEYFCYIFVSVIIVHTSGHKSLLRRIYGLKNVEVIPHYLFPVTTKEKKIDLPLRKKLLVCFGRVCEKKGLEKAITTLQLLSKRYELLIVGKGSDAYISSLVELARNLGVSRRVHFMGYCSDEELSYIFKRSYAALLLYNSVTQSGVLATVLSYNVPVILSKIPSFVEFNKMCGVGILTNDTKESVAAAVEQLHKEMVSQKSLIKEACEKLSLNAIIERHTIIYKSIR